MTDPVRPIGRALDLKDKVIDRLFTFINDVDAIVGDAATGRSTDKRAVSDLMDLFNNQNGEGLKALVDRAISASMTARAYEEQFALAARKKDEAKPSRKRAEKKPTQP